MSIRTAMRIIPVPGGMLSCANTFGGAAGAVPGWWVVAGKTCYCAYQPKGAASYVTSLNDLSGSINHATEGVAPDWDGTNGWKFNGIDDYLKTTFVPANDQSQTILVQFTNSAQQDAYLCGVTDWPATAYHMCFCTPYANVILYANGKGSLQVNSGLMTAGNIGVAGAQGYRDGVADGGALTGYTDTLVNPIYIGCQYKQGSTVQYRAVYIQAFVIYSDALTAGEVATVAAAMAAL